MTKLRWMFSIYIGNGYVRSKGHKYYIDKKYKKIDAIARYIGVGMFAVAILLAGIITDGWFEIAIPIIVLILGQITRYFILPKDFENYITIEKEEN